MEYLISKLKKSYSQTAFRPKPQPSPPIPSPPRPSLPQTLPAQSSFWE